MAPIAAFHSPAPPRPLALLLPSDLGNPVPFRRFLNSWPALAALLFLGGTVALILPNLVIALDDDFWYLRSVVSSIQKARPWTDNWLTPWSASTTSLSALLYQWSGRFSFAIHSQLVASAALAAFLATLFLRRQGTPPLLACAAALLVLATPTVLFMFLMYTGVALTMACLWACLLFADRRQWLWFLLPWALAVANRQSAVAWLALPAWAFFQEARTQRHPLPWTPTSRRLLALFLAAGAMLLTLKLGMNPTAAQKLVLGGFGHGILSAHSGIPCALGLLAFLAGLAASSLLRGPRLGPPSRRRLLLVPALAAAGASGALCFRSQTLNTHGCYSDPFSDLAFPLLGGLLGASLALSGTRPRADASLAALAAIALVALYGGRFDYYFNDALFFGLAAGFSSSPVSPAPAAQSRRGATALLLFTGFLAAAWHAASAVRLRAQQERTAALTVLYERALRSGRLAPENVGMASFGYLGWIFQDYYSAHDGRLQPVLGGFCRYAQIWDQGRGTGILATLPKSLHPWRHLIPTRNSAALRRAPGVPILEEIARPLFPGHLIRYALLHQASPQRLPGSLPFDSSQYQRPPFPLDDAEWRQFIANHPLP